MTKIKKVESKKTNVFKPIKPFKSYEEEANFWDTHSVIREIDDGALVGFHQANKNRTITIRFEEEHLQELRLNARKKGIGPTTLARMWILEQLRSSQR